METHPYAGANRIRFLGFMHMQVSGILANLKPRITTPWVLFLSTYSLPQPNVQSRKGRYTNAMNEYAFLLAIAGVLFAGAMSPGPSFFVVARNSLGQSRAHGIATSLGTGLGVALFAVLASLGVTALIKTVPNAYLVFKLVGGGYLLYLAWRIWGGAREPLATEPATDRQISLHKAFLQGLITQTSNPKTALVIAGIFAAFVPSSPPSNTTLLVALIAFIIDFSWYATVTISLSTEKSRRVYQRAKFGFDRTAAVFLGAVGIKLLFTQVD